MERIKNYAVILKEFGCLIQCAKFEQALQNPQFLGFQFPVCAVFGVSTKKIPQKMKKANLPKQRPFSFIAYVA